MVMQEHFESTRVGTDMSLAELNTPEYILERGIIGEAREALEALSHGMMAEAQEEAIDVMIFLASLFNHLDMSAAEVEEMAIIKMSSNYEKYANQHIRDKTIKEGLKYAKQKYNNNLDD